MYRVFAKRRYTARYEGNDQAGGADSLQRSVCVFVGDLFLLRVYFFHIDGEFVSVGANIIET